MPLNSQQLVQQIEENQARLKAASDRLQRNIEEALAFYKQADAYAMGVTAQEHALKDDTLAYPVSSLDEMPTIGKAPPDYCVVATDSSPIPPDRHGGSSLYYVINVGKVMLCYGSQPDAAIDSQTFFYAGDVVSEESEYSRASLLDTECALKELEVAAEMARQHKASLVFRDGPLTLWRSGNLRSKEGTELRDKYYYLLEQFNEAQIPLVGYISNPHSNAVMETLREMAKSGGNKPFTGVQDRMVFSRILPPGTRSPLFASRLGEPKELKEYIDRVCFAYLNTGLEMVRVEFPMWLGQDEEKLAQALAIVLRQVELGQGYPVALMESHESAVLRGGDRELLRLLLEEKGLLLTESEKGRSKRLRAI